MDRAKLYLLVSAAIWAPYGVLCLVTPNMVADFTGMTLGSPTATTEIRAMYGGLQIGLGLFSLAALWKPHLRPTALMVLAIITASLATGRSVGLVIDGGISSYTGGAIIFEITAATLATFCYRSLSDPAASAA